MDPRLKLIGGVALAFYGATEFKRGRRVETSRGIRIKSGKLIGIAAFGVGILIAIQAHREMNPNADPNATYLQSEVNP